MRVVPGAGGTGAGGTGAGGTGAGGTGAGGGPEGAEAPRVPGRPAGVPGEAYRAGRRR
ncbi:hypothetical protein ACFYZ4_17935 [Streptomyces sp. NPDC001513]|uniref:hypothetical protein n=1 Tax=Streptomyces sp. NPDC001513 TaxID=3364580 RepID=UPI003677A048